MDEDTIRVLKAVAELPADSAGYVKDGEIAATLNFDLLDVVDYFQMLEEEGLLELARLQEGFAAYITAKGRLTLRKRLVFQENSLQRQRRLAASRVPVEIQDSLSRFREDHGEPKAVAFVMMKFEDTPDHRRIVKAIKEAMEPHGIRAIRADEVEYHSDLYWNIMTYAYGSGFGVAVFDRITSNDFNPNVAYEVGYLAALGKPVCLLKDKTLTTLQADLIGKLYRPFDTRDPSASIAQSLMGWLKDKRLVQK